MLLDIWNTVFFYPVMNILLVLYELLGENLGLAIIVLTVLIRLVLFPLMKSQFDSSRKLKQIQPQLEKIKKKYSRNPQKVQEEQLKLYRKVGYNPLGCFVSILLPFPMLIAIYQAIRAFSGGGEIVGIYSFVESLLHTNGAIEINTQFLIWDLSEAYLPLAREHGYLVLWILPYLLLAILTGISQYFSVKFNQSMTGAPSASQPAKKDDKKSKKKKDDGQPDMGAMMGDVSKSMTLTFPLMTTFIALSAPAAVALYWILQSWVSVGLYQVYNKFINPETNGKTNQKKKDKKGRK